MKLVKKNITLREKTINGILNNPVDEDIQKFIYEIRICIEKINYFVNNIDFFSNYERYYFLKTFCDIIYEQKDYLRLLTMEYKEHYVDYINIKTYMCLGNQDYIEYFGATTKENVKFNNERLSLKEIRNLIRKNKFLILSASVSSEKSLKKREKYEKHQCLNLDITNQNIDENSILFKHAIKMYKKEILKKDMLLKVREYYYELMHQVKSIIDLSNHDKKDLAAIGKRYKNAYDKAIKDKEIAKVKKIVVSHKKNLI